MHTVVETPSYLQEAEGLFSQKEMESIVLSVAQDPEVGEVMRGTGGFRKFRVGRGGKGKRGGARVVYIHRDETFPIFLVTVFAKNEKDNLSQAERNALKKTADRIFVQYRRR